VRDSRTGRGVVIKVKLSTWNDYQLVDHRYNVRRHPSFSKNKYITGIS